MQIIFFACETVESKYDNKLFITFSEEFMSSDSFNVIYNIKNSNSDLDLVNNYMFILVMNSPQETVKKIFHNVGIFLRCSHMNYNH